MQFSERLNQIHPSQTLAINARAQELRARGIDIISLAVGEPDFPTPEFIRAAAKKALDDNFTRYTPVAGIPALREAAGRYFGRQYNVQVPAESIIIGAGGKQCLYNFMQCYLNPGDEVLLPAPYWVSYPDIVLLASAHPVAVPARASAGFKITPKLLEAYATERTRLLILNSPSNPTGAVYTEAEMGGIMRWALERRIFVLSDEIYDQLVYPPAQMTSAIKWFQHSPELVAVVNGLSKSHAMTGWRTGFLAGHPELVKKLTMVQSHSLSNICSFVQKAALAALDGPQECVAEMRRAFERRRNLAMDIVSGWKKAICPRPDGAFYLFVDVSAYYSGRLPNSQEFCKYMLENAHVALVPGSAFGDDNCVRFSFAVADETLARALEQVGNALAGLE